MTEFNICVSRTRLFWNCLSPALISRQCTGVSGLIIVACTTPSLRGRFLLCGMYWARSSSGAFTVCWALMTAFFMPVKGQEGKHPVWQKTKLQHTLVCQAGVPNCHLQMMVWWDIIEVLHVPLPNVRRKLSHLTHFHPHSNVQVVQGHFHTPCLYLLFSRLTEQGFRPRLLSKLPGLLLEPPCSLGCLLPNR